MPIKRPFRVTLLLWTVLFLSAWGLVRLFATVRGWNVLLEFEASLSPLYLSLIGAGWAATGGVIFIGLLARKQWSYPAAIASTSVWLVLYWVERLFFEQYRANLPFAVTVTILAAVILIWMAVLPGVKTYFVKSEEHEQQVKTPDPE